MGIFMDYVVENSAKKKKTHNAWLQSVVDRIPSCTLSTHVGKFTNPEVKVNILDRGQGTNREYVSTDTVTHDIDIVVSSAAYLSTASLLMLPLEDRQLVLLHLKQRDLALKKDFTSLGIDYEKVCTDVDGLFQAALPDHTDQNLKQVYFPVSDGNYHLLTVMPSSSLLLQLKKRIDDMGSEEREHKKSGEAYTKIFSLTGIGFGGTKPQNISTLNSRQHGIAYLLPSLPPQLELRTLRFPKRDFFRESIPYQPLNDLLHQLHVILKTEKNNMGIRMQRDEVTAALVDLVLMTAYEFRKHEAGWSNQPSFSNLPQAQKIFLDDAYKADRSEGTWQQMISRSFARYIISQYEKVYEKVMKSEKIVLGDAELSYLQDAMKNVLEEEVRYGL
ncbi:type I-F CRISPR-associated protein Csy1 [Megasphaera elsdenii]|uniref:type I-F CRISPR-associated protein Csy1 n=1 Tax=Megasphaera elsdenii TaxID=907 RepID=UPI00242EAC58|nr:type I-F CRISPR-associated protein Csy1 [Megasphaera elsdenii]